MSGSNNSNSTLQQPVGLNGVGGGKENPIFPKEIKPTSEVAAAPSEQQQAPVEAVSMAPELSPEAVAQHEKAQLQETQDAIKSYTDKQGDINETKGQGVFINTNDVNDPSKYKNQPVITTDLTQEEYRSNQLAAPDKGIAWMIMSLKKQLSKLSARLHFKNDKTDMERSAG
ncbi:MAG: hypothetical protein LBG64_04035 [Pseudomonadales bacterium]|jgi:hypothetical protein|nr:hypothetical protein [Pseudomonadales bacterium]